MRITRPITKSRVLLRLNARSKRAVIETMTEALFPRDPGRRSAALAGILAREAIETTGLGHGVAFPHARLPEVRDMRVGVATLARPVAWEALDHQPVSIVFLTVFPPNEHTAYVHFVATLARWLASAAAREALAAAGDAAEVLDLLEQAARIPGAEVPAAGEPAGDDGPPPAGQGPLALLARLELYCDMLAGAHSGRRGIRQKIAALERLLDARVVEHFHRLRERSGSAVAAVEGRVCQGCSMQLPWRDIQEARRNPDVVHLCPRCRRFIYCV